MWFIFLGVLLIASVYGGTISSKDYIPNVQADFALKLLTRLDETRSPIVLSPISISIALAMAYAGAEGNTKAQLGNVIARGASNETILDYFSSAMRQLSSQSNEYSLSTANRIFVDRAFPILPSYEATIDQYFDGELQRVDFAQRVQAINEINDWVKNATNSKITELVGKDNVDGFVSMILANALYFNDKWRYQFDANLTASQPFFVTVNEDGQVYQFVQSVEMMQINGRFLYSEDENVQVLGLPYKNANVYMFIFLPKETYGLNELLSDMDGEQLLRTIKFAVRKQKVYVQLPKFKIENGFNLNKALKSLGVQDAFVLGLANFSKLSTQPLQISDTLHKAFVEVSEEGTEAAAATAIIVTRNAETPPKEFIANRPFMFVIAKQEQILFIGRFTTS